MNIATLPTKPHAGRAVLVGLQFNVDNAQFCPHDHHGKK